MGDKTKNIIVVIEFALILILVFIANIIKEDEKISNLERRKLAQFPTITVKSVLNGKASEGFEEYVTDQFIGRNLFKEIKYYFNVNILKQQDDNKLFVKDNSIYKMEYPLNEYNTEKSTEKIQNVYEKYLKGMNVYYSIIPDKNYYLNDNHLKIDYSRLEEIMSNKLGECKYIDIKDTMDTEDFYKTDLHWKQENILDVANKIKQGMNLEYTDTNFEEKEVGDFYGVYYGQVGTEIKPDKIKYLTNEQIENCITYNYENGVTAKIYDVEKYNTSKDKYDIFVSGPTALITIENPEAENDKELLFFRDSFGSSIAPFFIENYKKITLIDLRYIKQELLDEYIEFRNQDVIFLYSSTVLNQNIFK